MSLDELSLGVFVSQVIIIYKSITFLHINLLHGNLKYRTWMLKFGNLDVSLNIFVVDLFKY